MPWQHSYWNLFFKWTDQFVCQAALGEPAVPDVKKAIQLIHLERFDSIDSFETPHVTCVAVDFCKTKQPKTIEYNTKPLKNVLKLSYLENVRTLSFWNPSVWNLSDPDQRTKLVKHPTCRPKVSLCLVNCFALELVLKPGQFRLMSGDLHVLFTGDFPCSDQSVRHDIDSDRCARGRKR